MATLFDEFGNAIDPNAPRAGLPKLNPLTPKSVGTKVGQILNKAPSVIYDAATGKPATDAIAPQLKPLGEFGTGVLSGVTGYDLSAKPTVTPQQSNKFDEFIANRKNPYLPSIHPSMTATVERPPALDSAPQPVADTAHAPTVKTGGGGGGFSGGGSGSVAGYLNSRNANFNAMTRAGAIPVIRGNSTFYDIPLDNGGGSYHESFLAPGMVEGAVRLNRAGGSESLAGHIESANATKYHAGMQYQAALAEAKGHVEGKEKQGQYSVEGRRLSIKPLDAALNNQYAQEDNERQILARLAKEKDPTKQAELNNALEATRSEIAFQKKRVQETRNLQLQLPGMPQPPDQSNNY